jgi:3-phenylpropionate/trans-cinnamate dioxygenase ferredoxin reductase subunit
METAASVASVAQVGRHTVAVEFETPDGFDAKPGQFVKLTADVDGESESAFYTISSPTVEGTFETTVSAEPDGTLGPWLADRDPGDDVELMGPFGDDYYEGEPAVAVFAGGPGIGPGIAIAERANAAGGDATLVYRDDDHVYEDRLDRLERDGVAVERLDSDASLSGPVADAVNGDEQVFAYGFAEFVDEVRSALDADGHDPAAAKIENFG